MTLKNFQQQFINAVAGEKIPEDLLKGIFPGGRMTSEKALNVYREGHTARMTEALGETFEAVWWALGDEDFFQLCRDYIRAYPPQSHSLSDYGDHFAEFIKTHPAGKPQGQAGAFVSDLARFEWKFKDLFHTRQHTGVNPTLIEEALRSPIRQLYLKLGQASFLFESPYDVAELWRSRKKETLDPSITAERIATRIQLLVYKKGGLIYFRSLVGFEWTILTHLQQNYSLESALNLASETNPDLTPELLTPFFNELLLEGIFERYHTVN